MRPTIYALIPVFIVLSVCAKEYPRGFEHSNPPVGDEFLTNRFGRTWADPVYSGYLIVDDHYVDAPYVVEQRGFVMFVNGERVADAIDIRMVLPPPWPEPVMSDPGLPRDITHTTRVCHAMMNPVSESNRRYWDYLMLCGQARVDAYSNYMKRLPCVTNVVDRGLGVSGGRKLLLYGYLGDIEEVHLSLSPRVKPVHEDSGLYTYLPREQHLIRESLQNNRYRRVIDQNLRLDWPGPQNDELPQWYAAFRTMESATLTATQRFERLKVLRMISHDDRMSYCQDSFPIRGFHTSSQLWQRLSGDMSWTNDAPARLLALTNGWQKILPAFMRTQAVVAAALAAVAKPDRVKTNMTTTSAVAESASPPRTPNASVPPVDMFVPPEEDGRWKVPVAIALTVTLVLFLFLTRHLFRK